jgi:hypothetical protein
MHFSEYRHKKAETCGKNIMFIVCHTFINLRASVGFVTKSGCSHTSTLAEDFTARIATVSLSATVGPNITNRHAFLKIKFIIADLIVRNYLSEYWLASELYI